MSSMSSSAFIVKTIAAAVFWCVGSTVYDGIAADVVRPLARYGAEQYLLGPVVGIITDTNSDSFDNSRRISGSGFIIDKNGYILTNCHVIEGAHEIEVVFHSGMKAVATLKGKDTKYDIALLKIDVEKLREVEKFNGDLSTVIFDDSDKIEVTTPIFVAGHPFGLNARLTSGIISAKVRSLPSQVTEMDYSSDIPFLQIDAKISHGDSGGPLFTYERKVIGMVSIFVSDGNQDTNIGYAIPANLLKKVIAQLKDFGKVRRGWIGISAVSLDRDAESALGLGNRHGCVIIGVEKGSPSEQAGLQEDDILLSVNGENITANTNIECMLSSLPLNKSVPILVMRDGKNMNFNVKVEARDDDDDSVSPPEARPNISAQKIDYIPVQASELTNDLRNYFDIPQDVNGVLVAKVDKPSEISVGNVIMRVNQKKVSTITELSNELRAVVASKAGSVALYMYDPNRLLQRFYVVFRLVYTTLGAGTAK